MKTLTSLPLWHYTVARHIPSIWQRGVIWTANCKVPKGERAAAWFSLNQDWEPTAWKVIVTPVGELSLDTVELMCAYAGPIYRIEVDPAAAPYTWRHHRRHSEVSHQQAQALAAVALARGAAPHDWRVSYVPVPKKHWRQIQVRASADSPWMPWAPLSQAA